MVRMLLRRRLIRQFRKNEDGATAVELAMVLPVLLLVLIGIMELSIGMFINTVVEGSLREASRLGLTGQIQEGASNDQAIVDMLNEASLGLLDLTTGNVTSLVYENFASVGKGEEFTDIDGNGVRTETSVTAEDGTVYPNGEPWTEVNGNGVWDEDFGEAGLGTQGDIVLYTVTYNWNFLSGQVIPILKGTIPMSASIVVMNEPF
ncbi:TadE/TadG family type IV pilus assembly protein [Sneathiella aquimaris]|uniref:TadE/TadG family type IV pilus assembly protein n=1 Tax=Sneathiella aquimaris TaxID=2599305 RepID=UPI001469F227|nr:TadE/TadG family type IV pilus assembly protein [Sneathiella aquimaris]